jgi:RNA polymerase sigma-70 factor (ECF subfamily)
MVDETMDRIDPDAELMVAVQHGDSAAFEYLLDKYHRPIVNFIYRVVNNAEEAEELAQEVFLRIYRARQTYQPKARFASWIYKIATNLSLKEAARKRRLRFWNRNHHAADEPQFAEEAISDPLPDAERRLISSELGVIVRRAIRSLPPNERTALILRRYDDLSYKEIAEAMNCTEAAVKTYIHRGKLHVRDCILPYFEKGRIE